MNITLENQVAIVTGASRGIGKEIAKTLAGAGAAVALAARGAEALEEVAAEIRAGGGRALAVPTDVTDVEAVAALVSSTTAELGKVAATLAPLAATTLQHLRKRDSREALTGPLPRGDAKTIERQLAALEQEDPATAVLHRDLSNHLLEKVLAPEDLSAAVRKRLRKTLRR